MLTDEQKETLKDGLVAALVLLVVGISWYQGKKNPRTYQEPPKERKTVVVYGATTAHYPRIEVVNINNESERFNIEPHYWVEVCPGAYEGFYDTEVYSALRGDTLLVERQAKDTWKVVENFTAKRLINNGR